MQRTTDNKRTWQLGSSTVPMESRILFTQQLRPWRPCRYSFHSLLQNPLPRRSYAPKYRRWDSNAETIRSKRFGFNFGGKGSKEEDYDTQEDDDDEEEEDYGGYGSRGRKKRRWWSDEPPEMGEGSGGILEDAIDSLWILKMFKSYGWALPAIIISLLLSTGPKAFLMALALPLLQSAFSLAFDKLSGRPESRPKRRPRRRRKPFASSVGSVKMDEEKYNEEQDTSDKKTDYQSWVVGNDASATGQGAASFGGWDDPERIKSARKQSRRKPTGKGKLSQRERTSDTPLLLRLLIAVFPFLGYWTKMFW